MSITILSSFYIPLFSVYNIDVMSFVAPAYLSKYSVFYGVKFNALQV